MDQPDIICIILDILTESRDAGSIIRCKYICKTWYFVIEECKSKYIQNSIIFNYAISNSEKFLTNISASIIKMWKLCEFHETWIKKISSFSKLTNIGDNILYLLAHIPNFSLNFLNISENYEHIIQKRTKKWIPQFFLDEKDFDMAITELTSKRNIDIINIYRGYYEHQDIFNKILWVFILINIIDDDIRKLYSRFKT
jgi:hypothetical protein